MKKLLTLATLLPLGLVAATSTPKGFTDNLDEALATAKADGRYLYVCFSGSDWCGWCKKLEQEVLSKGKFVDGVTNDFVLVYIDSPNDQGLLSEHAKANNGALVEKYRIEGFPTALILDGDGDVLAKTGYKKGGAAKYVKHLQEFREKGPQLKVESKLVASHIAPFQKKIQEIMMREVSDKVEKAIADVPEDERADKAKQIVASLLPDVGKKIEAELAAFKATETPEAISAQKAKAVEDTEGLLEFMRKMVKEAETKE